MRNGNVGKVVFEKFEANLANSKQGASFGLFATETAADLVLQSPFVTSPLLERGIIAKGEHTKLVQVWQANLAAQFHGVSENKGYRIVTQTADKRASTLTEHAMNTFPKVVEHLKTKQKSEYDLYYGLRDSMLIENLQCDYISGVNLPKSAEVAASIALLRRLSTELRDFRDFLIVLGVDVNDDKALMQFAQEADTRGYIHEYYSKSLYFQRREGILVSKLTLTDTSDNVMALKRAKEPVFTEGKIAHAISKLKLDTAAIIKKLREKRSAV